MPNADSGLPLQETQLQPLPSVRMPTEAPLAAFGGGEQMQRAFDAAGSAFETAGKVLEDAQARADKASYYDIVNGISNREADVQTKISQMRGKDSLGAMQFMQDQYKGIAQDALDSSPSGPVKLAVKRELMESQHRTYRMAEGHTAKEMYGYNVSVAKAGIENNTNLAVQNAGDDEAVGEYAGRVEAMTKEMASLHGIPEDSPAYDAMRTESLSTLHRDVILERVNRGAGIGAKRYLDDHRDDMTAGDIDRATKAVEMDYVMARGNDLYGKITGEPGKFTLADGSPDMDQARNFVFANSGQDPRRTLKMWDYVKGRLDEDRVNENRANAANNEEFRNSVAELHQKNVPLDEALKLVPKFATGEYDSDVKQSFVRDMYAPPKEDHPVTYMNLWRGIGEKGVKRSDVDGAYQAGELNASEWQRLSTHLDTVATKGDSQAHKVAWSRVEGLARENLTDPKERAKFLYVMQQKTDGMPPDQVVETAANELKKVPAGPHWWSGSERQYKQDLQKEDAKSMAWGKLYDDLGKSTVGEIGRAVLYANPQKKAWGLQDVEQFAKDLGGYDAIKPGSPAGNAIQSLMRRRQVVTPGNVKAALQKYPNGEF